MNLNEFVNIISELLEHTTFDVTNTLACSTVNCGEACSITDDGKLLDVDDEVIFDFSDWDNEDDEPGEISAIDMHYIEVCYNYQLIKLVMPAHASYNLVTHFLKCGGLVK